MVDAKGIAERGPCIGSELSTSVRCQRLRHAKIGNPTGNGMGAGLRGGLFERESLRPAKHG